MDSEYTDVGHGEEMNIGTWTTRTVYGGVCETKRHQGWRIQANYMEAVVLENVGSHTWRTCIECHAALVRLYNDTKGTEW